MKRIWQRWFVVVALVAAIAVVAALALVDREPRFEGRRLSDWLDDPALSAAEIERGVRGIGTNALPHLQAWLVQKPALPERTIRRLHERTDALDLGYHPSLDANFRAMRGFLILGDLAAPAIPWLETGAERRDADFEFYLKALAVAGPDGLTAIERLLAEASLREKSFFINALANACPQNQRAAGMLAGFLADPDFNLRLRAMWAIRDLDDRCPPALADALRDRRESEPDASLRETAKFLSPLVDQALGKGIASEVRVGSTD